MYDKDRVQKILKINGLSNTSSDEDIRSVLLYAKCENVENAITALRDATTSPNDDICGLQKADAKCNILLADKRLTPEVIKSLLGIDMRVSFEEIDQARAARRSVSPVQMLGIFGWSVLCAALTVFGLMWYYQIGLFHPSM